MEENSIIINTSKKNLVGTLEEDEEQLTVAV